MPSTRITFYTTNLQKTLSIRSYGLADYIVTTMYRHMKIKKPLVRFIKTIFDRK